MKVKFENLVKLYQYFAFYFAFYNNHNHKYSNMTTFTSGVKNCVHFFVHSLNKCHLYISGLIALGNIWVIRSSQLLDYFNSIANIYFYKWVVKHVSAFKI